MSSIIEKLNYTLQSVGDIQKVLENKKFNMLEIPLGDYASLIETLNRIGSAGQDMYFTVKTKIPQIDSISNTIELEEEQIQITSFDSLSEVA